MVGTCRKNEGLPFTQVSTCVQPVSGKKSAGGRKRRWNDVLMGDLNSCDIFEDWKETTQDKGAWRCFVMEALTDFNNHMERQEKEGKDVRKKRKEEGVLSESWP